MLNLKPTFKNYILVFMGLGVFYGSILWVVSPRNTDRLFWFITTPRVYTVLLMGVGALSLVYVLIKLRRTRKGLKWVKQ